MTHVSDSREQRDAEPLILAGVAARLGVKLRPCSLRLPNGARIDVDGAAEDESVFCEVYARQGRLRGAQPKKVASDALKLITLARNHPDARLVLAFGDEAAAACVTGKSWLAETIRVWEIEVVVISLDPRFVRGYAMRKLVRSWRTQSSTLAPVGRSAVALATSCSSSAFDRVAD